MDVDNVNILFVCQCQPVTIKFTAVGAGNFQAFSKIQKLPRTRSYATRGVTDKTDTKTECAVFGNSCPVFGNSCPVLP